MPILVHFSAPVVVNESSPPVIGLMVGDNQRWATFTSGSESSILRFEYTVVIGDSSTPLSCRYTKICQSKNNCDNTEELVMRHSAAPILDADLKQGKRCHSCLAFLQGLSSTACIAHILSYHRFIHLRFHRSRKPHCCFSRERCSC